jgi:hypothetical protein
MSRARLAIRPIPQPLFRKNLRTALGKYQWTKLRRTLLSEHGSKCEICNARPNKLYAHEVWQYKTSVSPAVAHLSHVSFLCVRCHGCEHFLLTIEFVKAGILTADDFDSAVKHFCRINRVSQRIFWQRLERARTCWKMLSKLKWRKPEFGTFQAVIKRVERERVEREQRKPKLRLDPATDSYPTSGIIEVRRGPKPMFGRALTNAERAARRRYFARLEQRAT